MTTTPNDTFTEADAKAAIADLESMRFTITSTMAEEVAAAEEPKRLSLADTALNLSMIGRALFGLRAGESVTVERVE